MSTHTGENPASRQAAGCAVVNATTMSNEILNPAWEDRDDADAKPTTTNKSRPSGLCAVGGSARLQHGRLVGSPRWANPFRAQHAGGQDDCKDMNTGLGNMRDLCGTAAISSKEVANPIRPAALHLTTDRGDASSRRETYRTRATVS